MYRLKHSNENNYFIDSFNSDELSIEIPNIIDEKNIIGVNSYAFVGFDIKTIIIKDNIKTLEEGSFYGLECLETVYLSQYYENLSEVFINCPLDINFIVPRKYYDMYINNNKQFCFFILDEFLDQTTGIYDDTFEGDDFF